jgi:hypothetical protein
MRLGIRRLLTGLYIPQEYICVGAEQLSPTLKIVLTKNGSDHLDVSHTHLLLGYKPLVIAIAYTNEQIDFTAENVVLNFYSEDHSSKIAQLSLHRLREEKYEGSLVVFYEGTYGKHQLILKHQQFFNSLFLNFTRKSKSNISLDGNLYEQVRIAYSLPRIIGLITVGDHENVNLFPTDLHGEINSSYYASSLRIGGEALKQVEYFKRILISEVDTSIHEVAYGLGKNHMRSLMPLKNFPLSHERSDQLNLPIPLQAGTYRELELIDSWDIGVHRILIYKIISKKKIKSIHTLAHIHQYYAQWRLDHNQKTELLLR